MKNIYFPFTKLEVSGTSQFFSIPSAIKRDDCHLPQKDESRDDCHPLFSQPPLSEEGVKRGGTEQRLP